MGNISMKGLLEAGVHFGHQTSQWNPKMSKYIFGQRNKVHIIDLAKTVKELRKVHKFVRDISAEGKSVLFVGTKHQARDIIKREAERCGAPYVMTRWLGGCLTNFETVKKRVERLKELEKMKNDGVMDKLPKKEVSRLTKELKKLEMMLSGIKNMPILPGALFIIDPVTEKTAVNEARRMKIPVTALCDTNSDPAVVTYSIPGNDDAIKSLNLLITVIADAVIEGKAAFKTAAETKETDSAANKPATEETAPKQDNAA
ncbi:MAG: 30S ribosomal protein S2 [Elusimicrobia bacterium ADurb.Bin231]|nr:MAG: 30S ribosomal protein S2 [Elusimicrobia bacterium ADurb.Bin231]